MEYHILNIKQKMFLKILKVFIYTSPLFIFPNIGYAEPSKPIDPMLIEHLEHSVPDSAIEQFLAGADADQIFVSSRTTLAMVIEQFHKGEVFEIRWRSLDGGGGLGSAGGAFSLSATIGQPDAAAPMSGGNYILTPGFWALHSTSIPPELCEIFCDGFESGNTAVWSSGS